MAALFAGRPIRSCFASTILVRVMDAINAALLPAEHRGRLVAAIAARVCEVEP